MDRRLNLSQLVEIEWRLPVFAEALPPIRDRLPEWSARPPRSTRGTNIDRAVIGCVASSVVVTLGAGVVGVGVVGVVGVVRDVGVVGVSKGIPYVLARPESESGTASGADLVPSLRGPSLRGRHLLIGELGLRQFTAIEPCPLAVVANVQLEAKARRFLGHHLLFAMRTKPIRTIGSRFTRTLLSQRGFGSLSLALYGDVAT